MFNPHQKEIRVYSQRGIHSPTSDGGVYPRLESKQNGGFIPPYNLFLSPQLIPQLFPQRGFNIN